MKSDQITRVQHRTVAATVLPLPDLGTVTQPFCNPLKIKINNKSTGATPIIH